MAKVYSFLGENDKAFEYLDKFRPWYGLHKWIDRDVLFEPIRNDPRFRGLLERCQTWSDSLDLVVQTGLAEGRFPFLDQLD